MERSSNMMWLSLALGLPGCISCIASGNWGSRYGSSMMAVALVERGTGTAIQAAASIPRVTLMAIRGQRNCCRNGIGRSISLASRRTSVTSTMLQTSSICGVTFSSMRGSPQPSSTKRRTAGNSRLLVGSECAHALSSPRSGCCLHIMFLISQESIASRASRIIPPAGRRKM